MQQRTATEIVIEEQAEEDGRETYEEKNNDKEETEENRIKQTESTRRILPPRKRELPVRYGDYRAYLTEIEELSDENLTYDEALKGGWHDAIEDEVNNILENETWERADDNNQPRIDVVWKFKLKLDSNGKEIKKTRLVARGCKQDKNKGMYAHVPSSTAIKTFLAIITNRQLVMEQMDIKAAYLNSCLSDVIYMKIPKGFPSEGGLCKLRKAIYSLRQASQAWIAEFRSFMEENKFSCSEADTCLYKKEETGNKASVYVLN